MSEVSSDLLAPAAGSQVAPDAEQDSPVERKPDGPKHIPGIDGLRTLAVFGVIVFHLGIPGCFLGWSGVWLFFVISGFLITGILLDAKQSPNYFKNFYVRRSLRIFPIYFVCLVALYFVARLLRVPTGGVMYYVFYMQNYHLAATSFQPAFPASYNHTWTLAVEEQFYFLWPLIVRFSTVRGLLWVCVAAIAAAPISRGALLAFTGNPYESITSLIANVDALAIGALIAVWFRLARERSDELMLNFKFKRRCEEGLAIACIIVLVFVLARDRHDFWTATKWMRAVNVYIAFTTALSILFGLLLIHVVLWNSWFRRFLEVRLIARIGKISYGIYIFHGLVLTYTVPLLSLASTRLAASRPAVIAANLLVPYLLAVISWKVLENPFLRLKEKFI